MEKNGSVVFANLLPLLDVLDRLHDDRVLHVVSARDKNSEGLRVGDLHAVGWGEGPRLATPVKDTRVGVEIIKDCADIIF